MYTACIVLLEYIHQKQNISASGQKHKYHEEKHRGCIRHH
jgi:hypothetical protein